MFNVISTILSDKREWVSNILLIIFVGLVAVLPVLIFGFPFFGIDSTINTIFYTNFAEQFWEGELYPRWLMKMNAGLGSPTFFYYPPMAYYLAIPFNFLSKIDPHGWYQLGIAASIGRIASGICAYLWLKRITSRTAAAIAAALYIWMPFHLAFDLYRRGGFAELWTFVWMPLILYFTHKISSGRKSAVVGLSVSYALLIMTHLPTTLIFSLLPVFYALYLAEKNKKIMTVLLVSGAMMLGISLAAIYLLPAMIMQSYVQMEVMFSDRLNYRNGFVFNSLQLRGTDAEFSWMVLDMAALAVCAYLICRANANRINLSEAKFWLIVVGACIFMMIPFSRPLWELLPVLQKIQFPWRFNVVLCLLVTPLLALGFSTLEKPYFTPNKKIKIFVLILILVWIPYTVIQVWRDYPLPGYMREDAVANVNRRIGLGIENPGFQNAWSIPYKDKNPQLSEASVLSLIEKTHQTDGKLIQIKVVEGTATTTVEEWKPRKIRLQVETPSGALLNVSQFYFPGWTARLDDGTELTVQSSTPDGLISVFVPTGNYQLTILLEPNFAEQTGKIISLISLAIIILLSFLYFIRKRVPFFDEVPDR